MNLKGSIAEPSPFFANNAAEIIEIPMIRRLIGWINLALTAVSPSNMEPSKDIIKTEL